jgi:hypothetical protein
MSMTLLAEATWVQQASRSTDLKATVESATVEGEDA